VKIPRIVMVGPKDRVATWSMFLPRTPMIIAENRMYSAMGMVLPRMIAFFRSFSWPLISSRSSDIDVNPMSAKMTIPIGSEMFAWFQIRRFDVWICGRNLIKMVITIVMIARTPHVSIFLRPLSPSFIRSVMISQKPMPRIMGFMLPGRSFDRDCPSPIR